MIKKTSMIAVSAAMALSACTPTAGEDPNNAQTGAIIGGLLGGWLGSTSSDDKLVKGVIGAGVGAAIGGAIGQQLDQQAQDLRRDINNDDIGIVNTGSELRVTMPQDLLFATDSTALSSTLRSDLRALANNLQDYPNTMVNVIGHTDSTGTATYNADLSERRALVVSQVLRDNGVQGGRIMYYGRGESQPVASNASSYGRSQNRRVEIIIRPTGG